MQDLVIRYCRDGVEKDEAELRELDKLPKRKPNFLASRFAILYVLGENSVRLLAARAEL